MTGLGDKWSSYIPADQYEAYRMSSEGTGCGIGVSVTSTADTVRISIVYDVIRLLRRPASSRAITSSARRASRSKRTARMRSSPRYAARRGLTWPGHDPDGGRRNENACDEARDRNAEDGVGRDAVGGTGYIRIESFHTGVSGQFRTALDTLTGEGMTSLVIDVRHNGGGKVKEMSEILDPLLPEGTIMTLREKDGHETVYSSDADMIDLPIAVLIDDQSISAAEFFAAALQEYERATLVGTHTTGKGRAQRTYALSDGSAVNLSVEEYFTPKGKSLADTGIAPDIEITLTDEQTANFYFLGTDGDPQLQRALSEVQSLKN